MIQTSVSIKHQSAINQRNTFSRLLLCYSMNMFNMFLKLVLSAYKNIFFSWFEEHSKFV